MNKIQCIYCLKEKEDSQFSLEHIIPQFLGGSTAPDFLKTRRVCKKCNSNLGLFVDASFEKNLLISNHLNEQAYAFFDPDNPIALPLRCMGVSDLTPPFIEEDEVCECWLGPLGEQIYWIRPKDDRLYWYSGGNPRTVKSVRTRGYYLFSERSDKNLKLSYLSLKESFPGRKVKKIICNEIDVPPEKIGFSTPDSLDKDRIKYFIENCSMSQKRHNQFSMYTRYDLRFLAKLAIGVSFTILGDNALKGKYANELHKALWHIEGNPEPEINGVTAFNEDSPHIKTLCGYNHATTLILLQSNGTISLNININGQLNWVVRCADITDLTDELINTLGDGLCIVLFKPISKCIKLSLPQFILHKEGAAIHPELSQIDNMVRDNTNYFKNL